MEFIFWGLMAIIILIAVYFENNTATKVKHGVVLGVTLPYSEINNNEVLKIIEEYKKGNKKFILFWLAMFLPVNFIKFMSLKLIYLFIWLTFIVITSYSLFDKYNKNLKKLKQDNNWFITRTRLVTIDTEVTRLKDKMPVSFWWFLPSVIVSIIPIVVTFNNRNSLSTGLMIASLTSLMGTITFMWMYRSYCKKSTEIYSEDSNVNIAYNTVYKRMWTMGTVVGALIQSLGMLVIYMSFALNINSMILLFLSLLLPFTVIFIGIYYINNRVTEEQNRLIETSKNPILVDNDEYWHRDIYNNPNDTRVIVEPRVGYKSTYNLGTKKGKLLNYGSYAFAIILVVIISIMNLRMDFSKPNLSIDNNILKIDVPMYSDKYELDKVEEIKMVDSINVTIKTNGAATEMYAIGYFNVEGYGNSKLFIYDKQPPYIMLKIKDEGYVFLSGTSRDETDEYYKKIINSISN